MRMRSLGAASAFAAASNAGEDELNASSDGAAVMEPVSIPLKDVLGVDEEVPSRNKRSNAGPTSDFYCSAASDVGMQKEKELQQVSSPSPPPSSMNKKKTHRIFLHTLSHGFVEFSLENANSHDMVMAYLKAHLEPDRIPKRGPEGVNAKKGGGALLRTMVLTPTKEAIILDRSARTATATHKAGNAMSVAATAPRSPPRTFLPQPNLTRSNSNASCPIDKLHSKVINQRLQDESTP